MYDLPDDMTEMPVDVGPNLTTKAVKGQDGRWAVTCPICQTIASGHNAFGAMDAFAQHMSDIHKRSDA